VFFKNEIAVLKSKRGRNDQVTKADENIKELRTDVGRNAGKHFSGIKKTTNLFVFAETCRPARTKTALYACVYKCTIRERFCHSLFSSSGRWKYLYCFPSWREATVQHLHRPTHIKTRVRVKATGMLRTRRRSNGAVNRTKRFLNPSLCAGGFPINVCRPAVF